MATDYSILESELTDLKTKLKRDLHMLEVRRLSKKKFNLAKSTVQRKQIENLTKTLAELEPTVSTLYCPQHAIKDNEIKSYLLYLLKMKDFFTREVVTKQEMINQRNDQIEEMLRKLCVVTNESAKLKRSIPRITPEFVRLENMSNRMNQMNVRICTMRQENKEIMENIINMKKFQGQFKIFERDFRRKIKLLKNEAQGYLDRAVAAYEEKDECLNKQKVFKERCAQELRKAAINENALNLCIEKGEKNETFAKLQDIVRTDVRIAETGDMIEKGITGLEPSLTKAQDLQAAISAAADEEEPDKMEDSFKFSDNKTNSMFSYFDEVLADINHLEDSIRKLRKENRDLMKNMSTHDRKLRKDITENKEEVEKKLTEAEESTKLMEDAKKEMDSYLDIVKSLYDKVCPNDADSLESKPLDDSNVIDYLQNMEDKIIDYSICMEYIRMQEELDEDQIPLVLETEDVDEGVDSKKLESSDVIQPRILQSESDLQSLLELETEESFLEFEELKKHVVSAITEVESGKSTDDEDDTKSETK